MHCLSKKIQIKRLFFNKETFIKVKTVIYWNNGPSWVKYLSQYNLYFQILRHLLTRSAASTQTTSSVFHHYCLRLSVFGKHLSRRSSRLPVDVHWKLDRVQDSTLEAKNENLLPSLKIWNCPILMTSRTWKEFISWFRNLLNGADSFRPRLFLLTVHTQIKTARYGL